MISRRITLSVVVSIALLTATTAHADFSQWMNNSWGNTGMMMDGSSMNSGGWVDWNNSMNSLNQSDFDDSLDNNLDDDTTNSDIYSVSEPKIHVGKLVLTNVGEIDISSTLYVYGDMEVMNVDVVLNKK